MPLLGIAQTVEDERDAQSSARQELADSMSLAKDSVLSVIADSIKDARADRHSPTKAAWRSAVLPGWGQVYNDKYWKVPIVYGGLGGLGYWIYYNASNHRQYRQAIIAINDDDSTTVNPFGGTESTLINTRELWRRQLDVSIIIFAAFYGLQIVDAVVDAHLYEFDISDDLSLRWSADIDPFRYRSFDEGGGVQHNGFYGFNLQLNFGGK